MSLLLYLFLFLIVAICVTLLGVRGIWTSLIALFNVLTAAVLALSFFEPAAAWLDSKMPSYSYMVDFLTLWFFFGVFVSVFGLLTGFASRVKVRFHRIADLAGGVLISLWVAWLLISFTLVSLHVAPLPRSSFGGAFYARPDTHMLVFGPDRKLLSFMHMISQGSFGKSAPEDDPQRYIFDPSGEFILKYGARRAVFETTRDLRVDREFGSGVIEKGPEVIAQ